ncbi:MAG: hypothetical protein LBM59_00840 [Ruminococcus sp.]|jgi:hypothetical protein|nr:hypothetical protein [Ruminococcus sp.]
MDEKVLNEELEADIAGGKRGYNEDGTPRTIRSECTVCKWFGDRKKDDEGEHPYVCPICGGTLTSRYL